MDAKQASCTGKATDGAVRALRHYGAIGRYEWGGTGLTRNKKLLGTSASLLVTSALLVTRSY